MAEAIARVTRNWSRVDDTLALSEDTPQIVQNSGNSPVWLFEGTSLPAAGFGESLNDGIQIVQPFAYFEVTLAAGDRLFAIGPNGESRLVY